MLPRTRTAKQPPRSRSTVEMLQGAMIDWNAVPKTLPGEFTLDAMTAKKATSAKPRSYLSQVVVRLSKEGRIKRRSGHVPEEADFGETGTGVR